MSSFLAMLASSSTEEMEAELQERVESSRKQASCVVEICESLKSTVDQLKKDQDSDAGERCIVGWLVLVYRRIVCKVFLSAYSLCVFTCVWGGII